jgi:hypothetical protein
VRSGHGNDGYGGGIYNCPGSTLTIINATISGNSAEEGGAICNGGTLTISNSTFSGNIARHRKGGGIHNGGLFGPSGTVVISNSTLSRNIAGEGMGGGIFSDTDGTKAVLQNSMVANNTGGNCHGTMTSNGYNLSSHDKCIFNSMNNTDPNLGPLQDNGGPTQIMELLPESLAIDTGSCTDGHSHLLKTDQRGKPRPDSGDSGGCDRGAYERQKD